MMIGVKLSMRTMKAAVVDECNAFSGISSSPFPEYLHKPCSVFFRLPSLKSIEIPVVFLQLFALAAEKIHYNICAVIPEMDY